MEIYMRSKYFKLIWILLLVISSFTLGYTLKPTTHNRQMPPFMNMQSMGGRFRMVAPPLHFRPR